MSNYVCGCSNRLLPADVAGVKMDIAILESCLRSGYSNNELVSEVNFLKSRQADFEAMVRKQNEITSKLHEENMFVKSKLTELLNPIFIKI